MAKIRKFDEKSAKNRARVRKFRERKKYRVIHEKYIYNQINLFNESQTMDCNHFSDKLYDEFPDENCTGVKDKATEICDKLKYWCVDHRITAVAMCDLLSILRYAGFHFLPKDNRTFMGTPKNVPILSLSNGKLWYNGIQKCLESALDKISNNLSITLGWNFDGFPIAKSSNKQFWPILASIRGKFFCTFRYYSIVDMIMTIVYIML